jgi:hypothetical protein
MKTHFPGPDGKCSGCSAKLATCHPYMQNWFWTQVLIRYPNAHVAWGYRGKKDQQCVLADGKSAADWPKSPHNRRVAINPAQPIDPSNELDPNSRPESAAVDLFEIIDGKGVFSKETMLKIMADIDYSGFPILCGAKFKDLGDDDHFQYKIVGVP